MGQCQSEGTCCQNFPDLSHEENKEISEGEQVQAVKPMHFNSALFKTFKKKSSLQILNEQVEDHQKKISREFKSKSSKKKSVEEKAKIIKKYTTEYKIVVVPAASERDHSSNKSRVNLRMHLNDSQLPKTKGASQTEPPNLKRNDQQNRFLHTGGQACQDHSGADDNSSNDESLIRYKPKTG